MAANHKLFERRHNVVALLDPTIPEAEPCIPMMEFLQRSRIHQAITLTTPIYSAQIADFWGNAFYDDRRNPPTLISTVLGRQVLLTEDTVRQVFGFGDDAGFRTMFPAPLIHGCLKRMGYSGTPPTWYDKGDFGVVWKYLLHIMIVCMSVRKSGFTGFGLSLGSAITALVLNKPFNFSGFIFQNLVSNSLSARKFYMYPRFVQLLINSLLPDLPTEGEQLLLAPMHKIIFLATASAAPSAPLFGHVEDPTYIAPENDSWKDTPTHAPARQPRRPSRSTSGRRRKLIFTDDDDSDSTPEVLPTKRRRTSTSTPVVPETTTTDVPASTSSAPRIVSFQMFVNLSAEVESLKSTLRDHQNHIEKCHQAVYNQNTKIANLQAQVDTQNTRILALETMVEVEEDDEDVALQGGVNTGPSAAPETEEANLPQQSKGKAAAGEDEEESEDDEESDKGKQAGPSQLAVLKPHEVGKALGFSVLQTHSTKYRYKSRRSERIANRTGPLKPFKGPGLTEEDSINID